MTDPPSNPPPILSYTTLKHPVLPQPVMRSGSLLVTAYNAALPPICPVCGRPGNNKPVRLQVRVADSFSITVPSRSNVSLEVTFCPRHYKIRRHFITIIAILAVSTIAIALSIIHIRTSQGENFLVTVLAFLGLACLLAIGLCVVIATRGPQRSQRHPPQHHYAFLKGVHPNLLAQLPSFDGPPSGKL